MDGFFFITLKFFKKFLSVDEGSSIVEDDLGKNVWQRLNVIEVNKVMVPRSEIVAIDEKASKSQLVSLLKSSRLARIPVYSGTLDNVLGFVHIKDVIQHYDSDSDFKIVDIVRKIIFVPGLVKLSGVLAKMKSSQVHAAIVLDEHGGTDGLVTMKDIVEEVMGDIDDEHDSDELLGLVQQIDDCKYSVSAKITIEQLEKILGVELKLNDKKYRTLNGVILNFLGRAPRLGETFNFNDITFSVTEANGKMVNKVTLEIASVIDRDR